MRKMLTMVACLALAACTKNSVTQDFESPKPAVYAALVALDPLGMTSTPRYRIAGTSVKVESPSDDQIVWRVMNGDEEMFRYVAKLTAGIGTNTEVALSLDASRASKSTVNPALAETTERLDKGRRLSVMAEAIASTLQHRGFETARVDARLKEFGGDDKVEQAVMVAKVPAMATSALGQYVDMQREIAKAQAEHGRLEAEHAKEVASQPASGGAGYASSTLPMTAAEEQAERDRNR